MAIINLTPIKSGDKLEKVLNTFAVRTPTNTFDYYRIKLSKEPRCSNGKFVDILKMPPIISEGYVYYKRNVYFVPVRDFLRRYVNVSNRPINVIEFNARNRAAIVPSVEESSSSTEQSGLSSDTEHIDHEAINMDWQDQINALQYLEDPEEGWNA
jgi:hypothetical protein